MMTPCNVGSRMGVPNQKGTSGKKEGNMEKVWTLVNRNGSISAHYGKYMSLS